MCGTFQATAKFQDSDTERSKTQEIKRTLFNWTKPDKTCKFSRSPFSSYVQHINKQLIQLISCQLDAGGWRKEQGTRLTVQCPFPSASPVFLFLCCIQLGKEDFLENLHILPCFVPLKSVFQPLGCFGIFFQNAGCQLCFRFCCCCSETETNFLGMVLGCILSVVYHLSGFKL